jgi:hypothetical protein
MPNLATTRPTGAGGAAMRVNEILASRPSGHRTDPNSALRGGSSFAEPKS